jgi:hypothetical protein
MRLLRLFLLLAAVGACNGNLCYVVADTSWRFVDEEGLAFSGTQATGSEVTCSPLGSIGVTDVNVDVSIVVDVPLGAEAGERLAIDADVVTSGRHPDHREPGP